MKRTATCLFVSMFLAAVGASSASAQAADDKEDAKGKEKAAAEASAEPTGIEELDTGTNPEAKNAPDAAAVKAATNLSWSDIVVVPRKAFLKGGRFELAPFTGISINDILIRHYVFGADFNFFLTDALWVGLQGVYYKDSRTEREALVGLQYNRIATLNRNLFGGYLNFGYVPAYGKFALFNSSIIHWEVYASGGFGVTKTEIIARIPGDETFSTIALTPTVAIGGRFFVNDWLTLNYAIRDYVIIDKFEPTDRMPDQSIAEVKANADSALVNNIVFYVGAGFYLPTKFQYKTPR